MGIRGFTLLSITIALSACAHAQTASDSATLPSNEWSRVVFPTSDEPKPIGFYTAGCLRGALRLPLDGQGYQVMRIFRNRYYGHPHLIDFLQKLGNEMDALGSGLLIGDLGQPRGGPLPYGHTSHQMGLDVDIWFWTHPEQRIRSLTADERNNLPMPSVLNSNGLVDPSKFTHETILKLKMAATDPQVERIFVNPAIKTYLCSVLPNSELYWLHNLRPWTGHEDHFHVRIACPENDFACTHQDPVAAGSGCKEVIPERGDFDLNTVDHDLNLEPKLEQLLNSNNATALPAECANVLRAN